MGRGKLLIEVVKMKKDHDMEIEIQGNDEETSKQQ